MWPARCTGFSRRRWRPLSQGLDRHRSIGGCQRERGVLEGGLAVDGRRGEPRRAAGGFVDECSTNTSLAPMYAWSPEGERALCSVPRNWGANITLLASMSRGGMGPCLAVQGSTRREVFEPYLEQVLAPS